MKKLKTWQIVLLVIFYPIGICVWIYRVWKKNKLKRDAAAAAAARREAKEREDAARLEAWRAERAARETLKFKVVGVTFKNEDGKSRQTLLRKLHFGDAPFNSDEGVDITIERGAYQGEPAFSVFAEGHQVGNISKDDVPFFVRRWSDFVGVTSVLAASGCVSRSTGRASAQTQAAAMIAMTAHSATVGANRRIMRRFRRCCAVIALCLPVLLRQAR